MIGEGIVLTERAARYRAGTRSPAWLKFRPKLMLAVVVTAQPSASDGRGGEAVVLEFRYTHPRTGADAEIPSSRPRASW
jgi:ATP-dependent DNA ligase